MRYVKYLPTDPSSCAGPLIPQRRAPKCYVCGRVLWQRIPFSFNGKGERLGYVPALGKGDKPRCWNKQLCSGRLVKELLRGGIG